MTHSLLKVLFSLLGLLPLFLRRWIALFVGYLIGSLPLRDRNVAVLQIKRFLPDVPAEKTARRVFQSISQTLLESINLTPLLNNVESCIECPNSKFIDELLSRERPIVALTAHTGNWELMAAYMVKRGVPLATVGRPAHNDSLQKLLADIRAQYGVKTLWRNKQNSLKDLLVELREGKTVAALIDQDTRVSSVFSPFFGVPARSPSGLVALGKRFQASLVTAFNVRTGPSRYTIFVEELDSSLTIEQMVDEFNLRLEHIVRSYPEQWVWFHKRWRSSPEHGTLSTSQYIEHLE
ncbi:MAG: lysophospholipid acyltransferase family protein, partial [Bdellovibrionales bacterium]|nr:lysophospholipid acyltransferase family protein [Bdellovibrionales bacterium]